MMKASSSENETVRYNARPNGLPHPESDERLDEIARLAAHVCLTPVALVSLVEGDCLVCKSAFGPLVNEDARDGSFCSWALLRSDLLIVTDASRDERFRNKPMVKTGPEIRFYAGAPLITPEGQTVGALAVMDITPRNLAPEQADALRALAGLAVAHLELKKKNLQLAQAADERAKIEEALRAKNELLSEAEERNAELLKMAGLLMQQNSERHNDALAVSRNLALRGASEGLWDWDLKNNEMNFGPRWKAILGHEDDPLSNRPDEWFNRVHAEDQETVHSEIVAHLMGLTPLFENEHRLRHKDGSYRWVLCRGTSVWDESKEIYRMAGSLTDITGRKEAERQLWHGAYHDPLTGLPNHLWLKDKLKRSLKRAGHSEDYLVALLLLDLDRLKVINESLGHQIGDQLLTACAHRLAEAIRPGDIIARMGGDKFAIILDHIKTVNDANQAAERILKALAAPFELGGREVFSSASIGIVVSLTPYDQPEDFIRDANTALNRAKERGRGRYELFDTGMHTNALALLQLETDMRRALARHEFRVYYQPIISLTSWRIMGFEALLRWQHPQHGLISPLKFIPMAEEIGLIHEIGEWALRESCQQMRAWQKLFPSDPPLSISVNLSAKQFNQPDLTDRIGQILLETGVDPGSLKIEITESTLIENDESAAAVLKELKEIGVRVSLDDFGTGYSSLSYLHRFPIDTLKIDRSFVTRMNLPKNSEIVRTIVTLANNLGLDVVAEGVETGEQVVQLTGMNCELVQGFLFSRPMDAEAVNGLLSETYQQGVGHHRAGT